MKTLILALSLLSSLCGSLYAQESPRQLSDYPAPRAPFVNALPDKAAWTITPLAVTTGEENKTQLAPAKSKPRVARIDSVKSGAMKRDVITYESGGREEVWYVQDEAISSLAKRPDRVIVQNTATLDEPGDARGAFRLLGSPTKSTGYPGFKWLDKKYFESVVLFNKTTPAYHYVLKGKDPDTGSDLVVAEAWIHAETGVPVAYSSEATIYVYHFGPEPNEILGLPAAFEAAYLKVKQNQTRQKRLETDAAALR